MTDERDREAMYREANGLDDHKSVSEKTIEGLREFTEALESGDISKYRKRIIPNIKKIIGERDKAISELAALKAKLPKNADGDIVFLNSLNYCWNRAWSKPLKFCVNGFRLEIEDGVEVAYAVSDAGRRKLSDLHSTAETCRSALEAAMKGGES